MQRALDRELLNERQFQEVWASVGTRLAPVEDVKKQLLRGEYMTNYQIERLAKGERSGFFYGPYKVLYAVGSGTFARVFRAVHRQTGEIVALKVLRKRYSDPDKPEQAAQAAQFIREGKLGLMLRHPNIVPIYDVASDGRSHYLVMEFVEGWNLRDLVKIRTKIEPLQATQLMMGMVEGLRYAFEQGLTHRDLKLNNVLVTTSWQPSSSTSVWRPWTTISATSWATTCPTPARSTTPPWNGPRACARTIPAATSISWVASSITCSPASRR